MSTGQETMAPDFWDPGTLGTIINFLPEDKSEVGFSCPYKLGNKSRDATQSRAVEDKFQPWRLLLFQNLDI